MTTSLQKYIYNHCGISNIQELLNQAQSDLNHYQSLFVKALTRRYPALTLEASNHLYRKDTIPNHQVQKVIRNILKQLEKFHLEQFPHMTPLPIKLTSDKTMRAEYMTGCSDRECELLINDGLDLFTMDNIINSIVHEYCHVLQGQSTRQCNMMIIEGTAYYYEEFIFNKGFMNRSYDIGFYQDQILRISRFILCILYQMRKIKRSEIMPLFQEMTLLPDDISRNETERICNGFDSLNYYLGKHYIEKNKIPIDRIITDCINIKN